MLPPGPMSPPGPSSESRFADGWKMKWLMFGNTIFEAEGLIYGVQGYLCTAIAVSSSTSHIRLNIPGSHCCRLIDLFVELSVKRVWQLKLSSFWMSLKALKLCCINLLSCLRMYLDSPGCWTFGSSEIIEGSIEKTGQLQLPNGSILYPHKRITQFYVQLHRCDSGDYHHYVELITYYKRNIY